MHDEMRISKEWSRKVRKAADDWAARNIAAWIDEKPRTWGQLKEHNPKWWVWMMVHIPDCPVDLNGLGRNDRAWVMAHRPDCPIILTGLGSFGRSLVMARRSDCPIDLAGLSGHDRARVMAHRPDCPVDLARLSCRARRWVMKNRPGYKGDE